MIEKLFFYLKSENGQPQVHGAPHCSLGHKIDRGSGKKMDGIYAQWDWDGRRLVVTNDRYGFYPLYYYWHSGEICVSPSIMTILEHVADHSLDYEALAVFLRMGFFINDKTPFKYIKAVPPDTTFLWSNGRLTVEGKILIYEEQSISRDKAVDRYIELFRQAIQRRRPDEKFVMLLSGGRDSRHILLELDHQGYRPECCITSAKYPPSSDDDIGKAGLLARALNLKHEVKYYSNPRFINEIRSFRKSGFCSDENTWIMDTADELRVKTNIIYDGIAGGIGSLFYPHHVDLMQGQSFDRLAAELFKKWNMAGEEILKIILTPDFYRQVNVELARESLIKEFKRHRNAAQPLFSFYFWNRTRREIALAPYQIFGDLPKVYSPYLDHDLFDFISGLPGDCPNDTEFHSMIIEKAYPKYAHIPYADDGVPRMGSKEHCTQFMRDTALYSIKEFRTQSRFLNTSYLFPRWLRALVDSKYCESMWWMSPVMILYLSELGKNCSGSSRRVPEMAAANVY